LRGRGILLAVCSKNNEADAKLPFLQHPEMVLKLEDISAFVANWQPKTENLRAISRQLNIGIDSLVFVDDSPGERELVQKMIPEIEVPEMPADPALYVETLHRELLFETITLTNEDKARAELYRSEAERERMKESSSSLEEFLAGLQMRVEICPFDEPNLPRIVQLINKTNQFNLTTRRMTVEEVRAFAAGAGNYTQFLHLWDRFGDSGITGVLMASPLDDALSIDAWLISCRVLGRGVEDAMMAAVWNFARGAGYKALIGNYAPTAKNKQVAGLYDRMGFRLAREEEDGRRTYRARLDSEQAHPAWFKTMIQSGAALEAGESNG
jgi:FkbH-like protein